MTFKSHTHEESVFVKWIDGVPAEEVLIEMTFSANSVLLGFTQLGRICGQSDGRILAVSRGVFVTCTAFFEFFDRHS